MPQRRDARGRFAGGGGGGGGGGKGGKLGKSAKNTAARAQYKKAATEARVASRSQAKRQQRGTVDKFSTAEARRTKSNLTRVTNKLTARGAASKATKPAKPAASRPAPKTRGTSKRGPRGGKVGTASQQRAAARAQSQRQKAFSSKATTGRNAKAAYRQAQSEKRFERKAASMGGGRRRKA
jgi:hypothetical protein